MILIVLWSIITISGLDAEEQGLVPWYRGCYKGLRSSNGVTGSFNASHVTLCSKYCYKQQKQFIAVQKGGNCVCLNVSADQIFVKQPEEKCSERCTGKSGEVTLPCGGEGEVWSIYGSAGPYIQDLRASVVSRWVVVGQPVLLTAHLVVPHPTNISTELSNRPWLTANNVTWMIGSQTIHQNKSNHATKIRYDLQYRFNQLGSFIYNVFASNHISGATTSFNVTVLSPIPRDLQIALLSPHDHLPSCFPLDHGSVPSGPRLVVFRNELVKLEFSVATGTNLTFHITFGDTGYALKEKANETDCNDAEGDCIAIIKDHVFSNVGVFPLHVIVSNDYGMQEKSITVVVMEAHLGEAILTVDGEKTMYETGSTVRFIVSVETTLRQTLVMSVDFGNGDVRNVSLRERAEEGSRPVDHLFLIASYGEGCNLSVEFQYIYRHQGIYVPVVWFNDKKDSKVQLRGNIKVLNRLQGPKMMAPKTTAIDVNTEFSLHFVQRSFNLTVLWTIADTNAKIVDRMQTNSDNFFYAFAQVGTYILHANVSNQINAVYTSATILVQAPVLNLMLDCHPVGFIQIYTKVTCESFVDKGSEVTFTWDFGDDRKGQTVVDSNNLKSGAVHSFTDAGQYQVSVTARNEINNLTRVLDQQIIVEVPIQQVALFHGSPTLFRQKTDFLAKINEPIDASYQFNFGKGRKTFKGSKQPGEFTLSYKFRKPGVYPVSVFAYNNVSEAKSSAVIYIEEPINGHKAVVMPPSVQSVETVFAVKLRGKISDREDLIYEWMFDDGLTDISRSPVVQRSLPAGNQSLNYTVRNQVASVAGQLNFQVDAALSAPKVIHSAVVAVGQQVAFRIVGLDDNTVWKSIRVNYGTGDNQVYRYPSKRWKHTFVTTGAYPLAFTILGKERKRTTVRSSVTVEEPIRGLYLAGPTAVEIQSLEEEHLWKALSKTGSHVVYTWSINNEKQNTTAVNQQVFTGFSSPQSHVIHVHAQNELSEAEATLNITVQYPITDVNVTSSHAIVGLVTNFTILVFGGRSFQIDCNFGDGHQSLVSSERPGLLIETVERGRARESLPVYNVSLSHQYTTEGHFQPRFNVSNLVSSVTVNIGVEVEEPISGIKLLTASKRVISLSNPTVTVQAVVQSGRDLRFKWSFGEEYYGTEVTRIGNNTSVAVHSYNVPGEYEVRVDVTNPRYPYPVTAVLPNQFIVMADIEDVYLTHSVPSNGKKNGAALRRMNGQLMTEEVTFVASVGEGSHMTYVFDFGDGETHIERVEYLSDPMTRQKAVKHVYTKIGVYQVKLNISNLLGGFTVNLDGPFYVQEGVSGVTLDYSSCTRPREEQMYSLSVQFGTNITIDWKMADETEFINQGYQVKHQYQTTGDKNLRVRIYNRVSEIEQIATISVVDEIQGVSLRVPSKVLNVMKEYDFIATPIPNIPGIAQYYLWNLEDSRESVQTNQPVITKVLQQGRHTLSVQAVNCISSAVSKPIEVYVLAELRNLSISSSENKLVGQPIKFWEESWEGDFLNCTWDFGDDTGPFEIQNTVIFHTYKRTGEYTVTLTARNPISTKVARTQVFILDKVCNPPHISKLPHLREKQLIFLKSEVIHIEANVEMRECKLSSEVHYSWTLINSTDDRTIYTDHKTHFRSLILPPRTLQYGQYIASLKVKMVNTIVYSTWETRFLIGKSPLQAVIDGGSLRKIRYDDNLVLDGRTSHDPDGSNQTEFRFRWSCKVLGSRNDSCFHEGYWPDDVNQNTSVVSMAVRQLRDDTTHFLFNLTVTTPSGQSGTTDQVIEVSRIDTILGLKIKCKQCTDNKVNPNYPVCFETRCDDCQASRTTYKWELKLVASIDQDSRVPLFWQNELDRCVRPVWINPDDNSLPESKRLAPVDLPNLSENVPETTPQQQTSSSTTLLPIMQRINEGMLIDNAGRIQEGVLAMNDRSLALKEGLTVSEGLPIKGGMRMNEGMGRSDRLPMEEGMTEGRGGRGRHNFGRGGSGHQDDRSRIRTMQDGRSSSTDIDSIPDGILNARENVPSSRRNLDLSWTIGEGSRQGRPSGGMGIPEEGPGGRRWPHPDFTPTKQNKPLEDQFASSARENPIEEHILSEDSTTVLLRPEQTLTGLNKQSLVISPGVLIQARTYVVKVTAHTTDNRSGEAMVYFKVNESPSKGLCTYKVTNKTERFYRVVCRGWRDQNMLTKLKYEVSYNLFEGDSKKLLYRGFNHEIDFQLPPGNTTNNNTVLLHIGVVDSVGAKTSLCPVEVQVAGLEPHADQNSTRRYFNTQFDIQDVQLKKYMDEGKDGEACNVLDNQAYLLNTIPSSRTRSRQEERQKMIVKLGSFPKRDEVEILRVAQSLVSITAVPEELSTVCLNSVVFILSSLMKKMENFSESQNTFISQLLTLAVHVASNIMDAVQHLLLSSQNSKQDLKEISDEALLVVDDLLKQELKGHCIGQQPIQRGAKYMSIMASHFYSGQKQRVNISTAAFVLPPNLKMESHSSTNEQCYQAHMTSFKHSPFIYSGHYRNNVQSQVISLDIYSCEGKKATIQHLNTDNVVEIWIPQSQPSSYNESATKHILKRNIMNIHQFNVSKHNMHLSLFINLKFGKIKHGRPFPIAVLIGQSKPPTPDVFHYKEEFDPSVDQVKVFLPSGSLNKTGIYYIGIVDSGYNAGRRRPGELMERSYSLLVWLGDCLYWDEVNENWSNAGCTITKHSDFQLSHCRCNHLTAFGGTFNLVPNDLSFIDVDVFFGLNENPVVIIAICIVLILYTVLMVICYIADVSNARKLGLVHLKDNRPSDKHKYEITMETGYRPGAGTSSKISLILHGEEGMSETRELISDDGRSMFEQSSRDIFIMTLPESLGRLWKVQLWHNNHGPSPSWYLSRVIIKDLTTGKMYYFLCEKWFAVDEDDGKVEREIHVFDSDLGFSKVFWAKGSQYVADYHLWLSLYTCPTYSRFTRTERLTCCLTVLTAYMCLNAVWYKGKPEYRGEFGLLDLSLQNIVVSAVCCCFILPLHLFLAFLFRRSKISYPSPETDKVYPSGKQNGEQISETDEESVQPVMTYSILDQSILNWQGIQDWAQKQWIKRQQSIRSNPDSAKSRPNPDTRTDPASSERDPNSPTTDLTSMTILSPSSDSPVVNPHTNTSVHKSPDPLTTTNTLISQSSPQSSPPSPRHPPPSSWNFPQGPLYSPRYLPHANTTNGRNVSASHDLPVLHVPVLQNVRRGYETDQASSGFVDATSQSQATAERTRIKLVSETSSSSRQSSTEYVDNGRRWRCFLPFWCRYVAWCLCYVITVVSCVMTVLYGIRFGYTKSIMWLQSLYFSFMICVFITQPLIILFIVVYTAITYRNDPSILNHHDDGYYGARCDTKKKHEEEKKNECYEPNEELEKGVAARQRSRYLRFARPPQEKALNEARKKRMKEKLAYSLFYNGLVQVVMVICVCVMAFGKDTKAIYNLNSALSKTFLQSGEQPFKSIKSIPEFYSWCQNSLLINLHSMKSPESYPNDSFGLRNSYLIGMANLRQLRVKEEGCLNELGIPKRVLPWFYQCHFPYSQIHKSTESFGANNWTWQPSQGGATLWGKYGYYDNTGYVVELNATRTKAVEQIKTLETMKWIDKQTRAIVVEFTLYYIPDNLFSCVSFLVELPESGGIYTHPFITSTYLFRYMTVWDNIILAFELIFVVICLHKVKCQLVSMVIKKKKYFTSFWCMLELFVCLFSLVYICCYIYRYILVEEAIERFRDTYYQQFINISFICFWNELLQALIGFVLFLMFVKLVRVLNHNSWCVKAAKIYKNSQKELALFTMVFVVFIMAFTSAGVALFGTACEGINGAWSGVFTMVMALTGVYPEPDINQSDWTHVFMFAYMVLTFGLLTSYILAMMNRHVKNDKTSDVMMMSGTECLNLVWDKVLVSLGMTVLEEEEDTENNLPAEFIMAEIEYQVDELLFRMNALSGSSALPDKPRVYFTDSDTTQHNGGDDGISTGGSEHENMGMEGDRLEQRVQRIEDKLCANEPYLAQLLKLDSVGADVLSQEKEKQLRSHLELEIFRQLQLQRQESNDLTDGPLLLTTTDNSGNNTEQSNSNSTPDSNTVQDKTWLVGGITGLENLLKLKEALSESSSSSPDSTHDNRGSKQHPHTNQMQLLQFKNCIKAALLDTVKQSSSSDNVCPQSSESDKNNLRTDSSSGQSSNTGSLTKTTSPPQPPVDTQLPVDAAIQIKPLDKTATSAGSASRSSPASKRIVPKIKPAIPPKPTFIRGSIQSLKPSKNSPKLRNLRLGPGSGKDGAGHHVTESSSGSEQDASHTLKGSGGKRALRKTRSQGRGKGHLEIPPADILGDLDTEIFGEEEEENIDDETTT